MNTLIDLAIFQLSVYGASYILTGSTLLDQPRDWLSNFLESRYDLTNNSLLKFVYDKLGYLINCIICASVWLAVLFFVIFQNSNIISISSNIYDLIIYATISPVFAMYMNGILMEERPNNEEL